LKYKLIYSFTGGLDEDSFNKFSQSLDYLGRLSGVAQFLKGPITTTSKILENKDQVLVICTNNENKMVGYLKFGFKKLYFYVTNFIWLSINRSLC